MWWLELIDLIHSKLPYYNVWLSSSVVVRALDLKSTGRRFDFRPLYCQAATLGKSFTRAQRLWSYDRSCEVRIIYYKVQKSSRNNKVRQNSRKFDCQTLAVRIVTWPFSVCIIVAEFFDCVTESCIAIHFNNIQEANIVVIPYNAEA